MINVIAFLHAKYYAGTKIEYICSFFSLEAEQIFH